MAIVDDRWFNEATTGVAVAQIICNLICCGVTLNLGVRCGYSMSIRPNPKRIGGSVIVFKELNYVVLLSQA